MALLSAVSYKRVQPFLEVLYIGQLRLDRLKSIFIFPFGMIFAVLESGDFVLVFPKPPSGGAGLFSLLLNLRAP